MASARRQPLVGPTWAEVLKLRRRAAPAGRARAENMAGAGGERNGRRRSGRLASDTNDLHTATSLPAPLRRVSREWPGFRPRPLPDLAVSGPPGLREEAGAGPLPAHGERGPGWVVARLAFRAVAGGDAVASGRDSPHQTGGRGRDLGWKSLRGAVSRWGSTHRL